MACGWAFLGRSSESRCGVDTGGPAKASARALQQDLKWVLGPTEMAQQRIILGTDRRDAEAQRDRWLFEHPEIKILRVHPPRLEPQTLLTRIGGRSVPRVSIEVEYE
jgi:hypothetical protein